MLSRLDRSFEIGALSSRAWSTLGLVHSACHLGHLHPHWSIGDCYFPRPRSIFLTHSLPPAVTNQSEKICAHTIHFTKSTGPHPVPRAAAAKSAGAGNVTLLPGDARPRRSVGLNGAN